MPQHQLPASTRRRYRLYQFVESFGETMVTKCKTCTKHNRVCRVHVRSGKCSECLKRGQRCDVKVTQSEFQRLSGEKERLQRRIKESREAQDEAMKAHEKALEDLRVARAREERLRQQMDLLDRRAEEAISVEEQNIAELEAEEAGEVMEFPDPSPGLVLSPSTWGAIEGFPLEWWDPSAGVDGTAAVAGGSS